MDHFRNPRNLGEIENADGVGIVGNPKCGDVMKMYIKVESRKSKVKSLEPRVESRKSRVESQKSKEEYIDDIKFQTLGCGAAIASSSIATEMAKGKTLEEALKISGKEISCEMGKFPPAKFHCSILAEEGIKKAILDFQSRKNKES